MNRTGTFITVHGTVQRLKDDIKNFSFERPPVATNVVETVLKMRTQRIGMIQTEVKTKTSTIYTHFKNIQTNQNQKNRHNTNLHTWQLTRQLRN